jgi:uncharacterized protein YodC (DUF2158 family)
MRNSKSTKDTLKVGDVVVLKSELAACEAALPRAQSREMIRMTVEAVGTDVKCVWFVGGEVRREAFKPETLTPPLEPGKL